MLTHQDSHLAQALDLDEFLTRFHTYLARPKLLYLQGDMQLYHTMLREMDSMQLPSLPALADFSHAFLLLQKRGTLSLQDIWGFARELEFFATLQETLHPYPESQFHAFVAKILIPAHLLQAFCIFDEKGEIQAGRFAHIDNLRAQLSSTQGSIQQALNALLAKESLAPYLVDKQIHFIYDAQTLLLKAGYTRVLKGSVLDRTQGGFFYVLPSEIARLYDKLQELRDVYALEVRKLCESLSEIARGELRFLRFLDRQFDVVDLLCGRVGFAKDLGLEFVFDGRVGFLAKNGDCGGDSALITTQGKSLESPCKAPFLAQKSCREQLQAKSAQSLESQNGFTETTPPLESTFPQNPQSSHSPTAIPRILEKEKGAECEKSCREQTELESTFEKVDSRGGDLSLRDTAEAVAWQSTKESTQVDSRNAFFASAKTMDCHASTIALARNDDKNGVSKKVDSRENAESLNTPQNEKVENVFDSDSQAEGFSKETSLCDDFLKKPACVPPPCTAVAGFVGCAWRGEGEGIYLAESQALAADSRKTSEAKFLQKSAQNKRSEVSLEKPTPKPNKAKSSNKTIILHSFCHPILKNPKPLTLTFDKGLLLLTGVNAGGKTMLLKSLLSAAFLAKLLLPMKINAHKSHIPHYKHIYAIISNPQSSRDDISTFAGRVLELSRQLDKDDMLLGIDEIELGTDADEAASLYKVLLELLLDRHAKLVVTTHHKRLASLMAKDPRIQLAAAMFDVEKSCASYTFLHGSIGKSYAFEIAQKFGIPKHIIARAKEHYGSDKERLNALIEQSSSLSLELESKAQELQKRIQKARNAKEAYSEKIDELERAYKARERELESTFNKALQALKAQANTQEDLHRNFNRAHEIVRHKPKSPPSPKPVHKEFATGDLARYGECNARILRSEKRHCLIELESGMRLKVEKSQLKSPNKASLQAHNATKTTLSYTPKASVKLDLHGLRAEEALQKLGDFISDSLIAGFDEVLIFHGIGTGVLSAVVKDFLQNHPKVVSFSDAPPNMGGYGAKLVRL
ncbi:Smr/MutS family protein [Helicobacter zhangjianzhongii]|uniref:Smr/MutS family protein n=1 Tax=Helicobacter zhangjianzhongii TaxID=2974574 RepID=A0ACC6FS96_9HELI|nr:MULTISPECIES: Smr/MutS family protein [unclassified Helicobacter]MDL0080001.1 Smr/MutS family protein [Helicobacter sp. CPD2-1]MDL0081788.1 Smr/MutS family protein [Helicobacter sp. XJK30-2]